MNRQDFFSQQENRTPCFCNGTKNEARSQITNQNEIAANFKSKKERNEQLFESYPSRSFCDMIFLLCLFGYLK